MIGYCLVSLYAIIVHCVKSQYLLYKENTSESKQMTIFSRRMHQLSKKKASSGIPSGFPDEASISVSVKDWSQMMDQNSMLITIVDLYCLSSFV